MELLKISWLFSSDELSLEDELLSLEFDSELSHTSFDSVVAFKMSCVLVDWSEGEAVDTLDEMLTDGDAVEAAELCALEEIVETRWLVALEAAEFIVDVACDGNVTTRCAVVDWLAPEDCVELAAALVWIWLVLPTGDWVGESVVDKIAADVLVDIFVTLWCLHPTKWQFALFLKSP